MHLNNLSFAALVGAALADPLRYHWTDNDGKDDTKDKSAIWRLDKIDSLVVFGDSLSDTGYAEALGANMFEPLEPGTIVPESNSTPSGGRGWPSYVRQYAEQSSSLALYNYAIAGAVCSSKIVNIKFPTLDVPMPGVLDYELPAFAADLTTSNPPFTPPLTPDTTVYSLWIGHNDLGLNGLLLNRQVPGHTLTSVLDCIFESLDSLYAHGARRFVLATLLPLELSPVYANRTLDGQTAPSTWPDKGEYDGDVVADNLRQLLTSANALLRYRAQVEVGIAGRWPGASVAVFDGSALVYDFYGHPARYFNGTGEPNVREAAGECEVDEVGQMQCELVGEARGQGIDGFLWYDGLHMTEQAHRRIAEEYVRVLDGKSEFAVYF